MLIGAATTPVLLTSCSNKDADSITLPTEDYGSGTVTNPGTSSGSCTVVPTEAKWLLLPKTQFRA